MRTFFDTNVLVYLFDADAPAKKAKATELLEAESKAGRIILSTQVLQELYVATTRKLAMPLTPSEAERAVRDLSVFSTVAVDASLIFGAIHICQRYGFSFWDGLIVQAALQGGASVLFTEDLQDGQTIESLQIVNPFRDERKKP